MPPQKNIASALEIDRLATQLAMNPRSKAFLPLAEEYCKAGMWEEAVGVLEDGLKHYPGFITAMVVLGRAYDQLNQSTKARAVLEGAVKLSPENLRAHRTLMKIYAAQRLTEEALKSCRVILAMNPRDEEALSLQASLGLQESETLQGASHQKFAEVIESAAPNIKTAGGPAAALEKPSSSDPDSDAGKPLIPLGDQTPPEGVAYPDPNAVTTASRLPSQADTVVQLEAWLRSLERQRRDRPTGEMYSGS
ncbi:MAG TPA: tetratricopeptide repeat protein [Nitrospira sp.]|nr:tetratricopeptide repeat protein [Nitrospira sp.]